MYLRILTFQISVLFEYSDILLLAFIHLFEPIKMQLQVIRKVKTSNNYSKIRVRTRNPCVIL